jgi:hypothetical protein
MSEDAINTQPAIAELIKKLEVHCAHRKTRRGDIRTELTNEVMKIMKADTINSQVAPRLAAPVGDGVDDDDLDVAMSASRDEEPEAWRSIEEGQVLMEPPGDDDDDGGSEDTRTNFIMGWIRKVFPAFRCTQP